MRSNTLTVDGVLDRTSASQDVTGDMDFNFLGSNGMMVNPGATLLLGDTTVLNNRC